MSEFKKVQVVADNVLIPSGTAMRVQEVPIQKQHLFVEIDDGYFQPLESVHFFKGETFEILADCFLAQSEKLAVIDGSESVLGDFTHADQLDQADDTLETEAPVDADVVLSVVSGNGLTPPGKHGKKGK